MKKFSYKNKVIPIGAALAVSAGLFYPLTARADDFDGKAYIVWQCGQAKTDVCYHLFNDIRTDNKTSWYNASTVIDQTDPTKVFDPSNVITASMVLKTDFENYIANASHLPLNVDNIIGPDGIDLNPLTAPNYPNAWSHYGDYNFRITIYNNDFAGIKMSESTYAPDFLTDILSADSFDVSGTTSANPSNIKTIVYQDEITFEGSKDANNNPINGVTLKSIEALDASNADAVETSTPSAGKVKVKFNSNFYDRVIFRITDTNNNEYFVRLARLAIDVPRGVNTGSEKTATAIVYVKDNGNVSCDNYEVTARIAKTNTIVRMTPTETHDDGFGNPEPGCISDGGPGLKKLFYEYTFPQTLSNYDGIFFNVRNAGSTATEYKGTISGSGQGILYDLRINSKYSRQINLETNAL